MLEKVKAHSLVDAVENRNVAAEPAIPESVAMRTIDSSSNLTMMPIVRSSTIVAIIVLISLVSFTNSPALSQPAIGGISCR